MNKNDLWTVIHISNRNDETKFICSLLEREGFMVKVKVIDDPLSQIMVLKSEAQEAKTVINENNFTY